MTDLTAAIVAAQIALNNAWDADGGEFNPAEITVTAAAPHIAAAALRRHADTIDAARITSNYLQGGAGDRVDLAWQLAAHGLRADAARIEEGK